MFKKRKIDLESIKGFSIVVANWTKGAYYFSLLSGVNFINQVKELLEPFFDMINDLTDAS